MNEFEAKQARIRTFLNERGLDALLLRRVSSFAWATCGAASYVNTAESEGAACLLVTPSAGYLITNNIEAGRLAAEEKLGGQAWEFHVSSWHEPDHAIADLAQGMKLGVDQPFPGGLDLSSEIARLRARLTPEEGERFRVLGRLCAEAMDSAVRATRPGQSERDIAAVLSREAQSRGVQAIVNLVATDERVFLYRHPLPTDKTLDRYAMLVLCGRASGLVCSITRLVHFGPLSDELRRKEQACAHIDASLIQATRPDRTLGELFQLAQQAYEAGGYADEWRLHHQGGPTGYEPREYLALPGSPDPVTLGQAFAWNPSITGAKSEDTILVGRSRNEVLTAMEGWPVIPVTLGNGVTLARPAILEIT